MNAMRVAVLHTFYRYPGGEDRVVHDEIALLRQHGVAVRLLKWDNRALEAWPLHHRAARLLWNPVAYRRAVAWLQSWRPHVVHVHNTFPAASLAVWHAVRRLGLPLVVTVHNYRWLCPNGLLFRQGRPCRACVGRRVAWPAVVHGCWRGRAASAGVALMLAWHRRRETWSLPQRYIAPSHFVRRVFQQAGWHTHHWVVKPHFAPRPLRPRTDPTARQYALFVGRLSPEKGLRWLVHLWQEAKLRIPLVVVGDGPDAPWVAQVAQRQPWLRWAGQQSPAQVSAWMAKAAFLVAPSQAYETFGRVVVEGFAHGLPVLVSQHGALAELVTPERTGWVLPLGEPDAWAQAIVTAWEKRTTWLPDMGRSAQKIYEQHYSPEVNLRQLLRIYHEAQE